MMSLGDGLSWVNNYGKKQCRSLFWRMKAAVKNAVKKNYCGCKGKQQFKFQYDPSSYALNFDDGCGDTGRKTTVILFQQQPNSKLHNPSKTSPWVYVIWAES